MDHHQLDEVVPCTPPSSFGLGLSTPQDMDADPWMCNLDLTSWSLPKTPKSPPHMTVGDWYNAKEHVDKWGPSISPQDLLLACHRGEKPKPQGKTLPPLLEEADDDDIVVLDPPEEIPTFEQVMEERQADPTPAAAPPSPLLQTPVMTPTALESLMALISDPDSPVTCTQIGVRACRPLFMVYAQYPEEREEPAAAPLIPEEPMDLSSKGNQHQ